MQSARLPRTAKENLSVHSRGLFLDRADRVHLVQLPSGDPKDSHSLWSHKHLDWEKGSDHDVCVLSSNHNQL